MSREPNRQIKTVPADLPAPAEVRAASTALEESRARYFELRQERADHEQAIRDAQSEDVQATKDALAAGKPAPKGKAIAVVARGEALGRELEAARQLGIEAEDTYLRACSERQAQWLAELRSEREQRLEDGRAFLEKFTRSWTARVALERAIAEVERVPDPAKSRNPARTTEVAILDLRDVESADRQIEKAGDALRRSAAIRKSASVTNQPAALIAALGLALEPEVPDEDESEQAA